MKKILFILILILACEEVLETVAPIDSVIEGCPDINALNYNDKATAGQGFGSCEYDETPPTASITYPAEGDTLSGIINITTTVEDDHGISQVEFIIGVGDDAVHFVDTEAPYEYEWDTTTLETSADYYYSIKIIVSDKNDNHFETYIDKIYLNNNP